MNPALRTVFILATTVFCGTFAKADTSQIPENYGKILLAFTVNQGQFNPALKFTTSGSDCDMFFTPTGTTFLLFRETTAVKTSGAQRHGGCRTCGEPMSQTTAKSG